MRDLPRTSKAKRRGRNAREEVDGTRIAQVGTCLAIAVTPSRKSSWDGWWAEEKFTAWFFFFPKRSVLFAFLKLLWTISAAELEVDRWIWFALFWSLEMRTAHWISPETLEQQREMLTCFVFHVSLSRVVLHMRFCINMVEYLWPLSFFLHFQGLPQIRTVGYFFVANNSV